MKEIITDICEQVALEYQHHATVTGGDINHAFKLTTPGGNCFLKLNKAMAFPGMFKKEAAGLHALHMTGCIRTPFVIGNGEINDWQWLLLEWLEPGATSNDLWQSFGISIAQLHLKTHTQFGWHETNYIGSIMQPNNWCASWVEFYTSQRIMPLVKKLFDVQLFSDSEVRATENLCRRFRDIFPAEQPTLLHGDLWSGNFMVTTNRKAAIYDPAVYYGHREMDIAMTKLFGGFDDKFYEHYNEFNPLQKNWQQRISIAQLYPLLVHATLFGGNYLQRCKNVIASWR